MEFFLLVQLMCIAEPELMQLISFKIVNNCRTLSVYQLFSKNILRLGNAASFFLDERVLNS